MRESEYAWKILRLTLAVVNRKCPTVKTVNGIRVRIVRDRQANKQLACKGLIER